MRVAPNPATHFKVGRFWIPTDPDEGRLFIEGDGRLFWIGYCGLNSILLSLLKERGITLDWDILGPSPARVQGDKLIVYEESFKPLKERARTEVSVEEFLDIVTRYLKCPCLSDRNIFVIKKCHRCAFYWGEKCRYGERRFDPVKEIFKRDSRNYVHVDVWEDCGFAAGDASIEFRLEDVNKHELEWLKVGLRWEYAFDFGRSEHRGHEIWAFTKRYALLPEYGDTPPSKYAIVIDTDGLWGKVMASDQMEIYSYEDWLTFKDHVVWGLRGYLIRGIALLCWLLHGKVRPIYHGRWISAQFRSFWQSVEQFSG